MNKIISGSVLYWSKRPNAGFVVWEVGADWHGLLGSYERVHKDYPLWLLLRGRFRYDPDDYECLDFVGTDAMTWILNDHELLEP